MIIQSDLSYVNVGFDENANPCVDLEKVTHLTCAQTQPQHISIAWRNLRVEISDYLTFTHLRPVKKAILRRLNGSFEVNSLNGLMGPSGAGKTTLLNCLSGAVTSGLTADSEIYVETSQRSPIAYFIEQHVHQTIIGQLTVGQILRYAFKFKNGTGRSAAAFMDQHIAKTIHDLLLDPEILDRPFENCSGGEQKRIAIGQELMSLAKPDFLFVDEPTTGLDSFAALEVTKCLAQLATNHRMTVITSIHAPSDEILHYFSKLYVLAKGGVAIYSGPPKQLRSLLEGQVELNSAEQPIESLIKLACSGLSDPQVQSLANQTLTTEYQNIFPHLPNLTCLPSGLPSNRKPFSFTDLYLQICRQSRVTFIAQYRHFLSQLLFFIGITLTFASFFNKKMVTPDGCYELDANASSKCENDFLRNLLLTENINYICLNRAVQSYIVMCTSTMLYSSIVKVFRNEHRNRWYSLGVFYWATNLVSIFQILLFALILSTVSYFSVSEHAIDDYQINWFRFSHYLLCTTICLIFMQSLGQLVGVVILEPFEIAIMLSTVCFTFIMMLDDFFFKTDELKHKAFIYAADALGMKYVTRYLIYVFYGIDRCDAETQYSWVMAKNYSDSGLVWYYITRLLLNALVIRVLTMVFMFFKFNSFSRRLGSESMKIIHESEKPIPIDYSLCTSIDLNGIQNGSVQRTKNTNELQFEQFSKHKIIIAWRNLTLFGSKSIYEIGAGSDVNKNPILRNLNGDFRFSTLNALMGMSGAGKTSLLNVLNGRCRTRLSDSTQIYLSKFTKIETAFISQEVSGHLMQGLTSKQLLVYASRLKNRDHERAGTVVDHEKIAVNILDELNLSDAGETKVENCSGGERKRLALALELTSLQMPNLICIDEPTSGLDSSSAEIVISTLRTLTQNHNLTIIASIHQPNIDLLAMFDQLYVLARGGVCVYSGPPTEIQSHLHQIPQISSSDCKYPIETLIKHSCSGHGTDIVDKLSQINQNHLVKANLLLHEDTQLVPDGVILNRARFSFHSMYILTLRYLSYIRGYLWKEWLPFLALYIIYGFNLSIFFDSKIALPSGCLDLDDEFNNTCSRSEEKMVEEKQMFDNLRYNLFLSNLFLIIVMMQTGLNLLKELGLFFNEHRNGWYSTGSFCLTKAFFEILPMFPLLCIYMYICNIYESVQPGIYWHLVLVLFLSIIATQAMAYIFLILCNLNMIIAMVAGIGIYMTLILLSNLFISLKHLHYIYQIVSYFSIPRFTLESLVLLEYGFGRCGPRQIQPVLYWMSLNDEDYVYCICMLIAHVVLYRVIAIWMLTKKVNPKENRRRRVARITGYVQNLEKPACLGLSSSSQDLRIMKRF